MQTETSKADDYIRKAIPDHVWCSPAIDEVESLTERSTQWLSTWFGCNALTQH